MLVHVHYKGQSDQTIIMLHGTGGNENDLKDIALRIDNTANLIGIRGGVEENGMLRYFKRYPDGSFDLKDLAMNTKKLYTGILELLEYYKLDPTKTTLLGFSNGSNIAINIFKEYQTPFNKAILLHPSPVRMEVPVLEQEKLQVFLSFGQNDPFITVYQFNELKDQFPSATAYMHQGGHQLTYDELKAAQNFYQS